MNRNVYLLRQDERPSWVVYPRSVCRLVDQGLVHITPWHVLDGKQALERFNGLANRYPLRNLFPFAYRQDNDDVACWAKDRGEKVFVVHDFASAGFERTKALSRTYGPGFAPPSMRQFRGIDHEVPMALLTKHGWPCPIRTLPLPRPSPSSLLASTCRGELGKVAGQPRRRLVRC
jgi:hypothetical protein